MAGATKKGPTSGTGRRRGGAEAKVDQAISLIREQGGRSTTSRRVVIEALIAARGQLRDADQLLADIQGRYPSINDSTVYRTLDLLEQLGLVRHVHLGHGPSQWYLSDDRRRWYLTCTRCGSAVEADGASFDAMVGDVALHTGFVIDSGHFAVTGICAACRGERDPGEDLSRARRS